MSGRHVKQCAGTTRRALADIVLLAVGLALSGCIPATSSVPFHDISTRDQGIERSDARGSDRDGSAFDLSNPTPDTASSSDGSRGRQSDAGASPVDVGGRVDSGCVQCGPIVVSVQHVSVRLDSTSSTVSLPAAVTNAVPFVTKQLVETDNRPRSFAVDVFLSDDGSAVTARRADGSGTVMLEVSIVEFDASRVQIQSGLFVMESDQTVANAAISRPLRSTANAFHVFTFGTDSGSRDFQYTTLNSEFISNESIRFTRPAAVGNVVGHFHVAEALDGEFSTQHWEGWRILDGDTTAAFPIDTVDLTRSALLYSHHAGGSDASSAQADCWLEGPELVRCERGGSSGELDGIRAQIVEFGGRTTVEHGMVDLGSTAVHVLALPVTPSSALALGGANGAPGVGQTTHSSRNAGYASATFTGGGTELTYTRGADVEAFTRHWSVVQF